jgi:putative superfamily III holin-X
VSTPYQGESDPSGGYQPGSVPPGPEVAGYPGGTPAYQGGQQDPYPDQGSQGDQTYVTGQTYAAEQTYQGHEQPATYGGEGAATYGGEGAATYGGASAAAYAGDTGYQVGQQSTHAGSSAYSSGATTTDHSRPDVENESVGSLVSQLTSDFSTLVRQEVALAKAELTEEAKKAGKGAGMLAGAGFAGWMIGVFASVALMLALGSFMALGWAALIVTVLWAIVAAVLFSMGRKQLKQVNPKPEQTVQSLKEDKEWVKAQKS